MNNLAVLNNLDPLKIINNNQNTIKTSSNFNKLGMNSMSSHMKKNSENLFLVKNNNINLNNNSTSDRASLSQIKNEQFNKTNTFKPLDQIINPETERSSKNKSEILPRKNFSKIRKCH